MRLYLVLLITFSFVSSLNATEFYRSDREARKEKDQKEAFSEIKELLKSVGNVYDPEPTLDEPLRPERYLNDYWRKVASSPAEEREEAINIMEHFLKNALFKRTGAAGYALWRLNTAAALKICPTYPNKILMPGVFNRAIDVSYPISYNDCSLMNRLLGPNSILGSRSHPNASLAKSGLPYARTVKMAQLLIDAGADATTVHLPSGNLLHTSMEESIAPGVIGLYRKYGLSPLKRNDHKETPLHLLAENITITGLTPNPADYQDKSVLKAGFLFAYLSPIERIRLCQTKNYRNQTAHEILEPHTHYNKAAAELLQWIQMQYSRAKEKL